LFPPDVEDLELTTLLDEFDLEIEVGDNVFSDFSSPVLTLYEIQEHP
jgi:hypothetical protein